MITGAVGTGKTALTCLGVGAIADLLVEKFKRQFRIKKDADLNSLPGQYAHWFNSQVPVLFITEFQLIRKITQWMKGRDTWDWEDRAKYGLVILDDFGRGYKSDWSSTVLDEFMDWMWSNKNPIWVSTNFHHSQLDDIRKSDSTSDYKRMVDRLLDPGWTVQLSTGNESRRR